MRFLILSLLLVSTVAQSQVISQSQQKALNNFVAYANQSADEVTRVVSSVIEYYPTIHAKNAFVRYTCPVQLEDFYLKKSIADSKILGTAAPRLISKLNTLRGTAEQIDKTCKSLDTYHKLEDYKRDNFAQAISLINELQPLIETYRTNQAALSAELESVYTTLHKSSNDYVKTDQLMREAIEEERLFLNRWNFNLKQDVHSGWPDDKLEASISETNKQIKLFELHKATLKYPASATFKEALQSVLSVKRTGLDNYNTAAQKSDKHSNTLYLDLINYFNGAMIADYNSFIEFTEAEHTYYGLRLIKYVPSFGVRAQAKTTALEIKPFQDIPSLSIQVIQQKQAIPHPAFAGLINYIDFINESLRQVNYLQTVLRNLNSSATYYKDLTSFKGKGGLNYHFESYQLPLSVYQQTIEESKSLPAEQAKSLNNQATVLLSILKEMNQLSASLEVETKEKRYEQDNLKKLFEILERNKILFDTFDDKKERLYDDVRKIYSSYPSASPSSSWYLSGKALQQLTDYDHEALFAAKDSYKKNKAPSISTEKIDNTLRDVISNEYSNMKGIEKFGRSNGNCPYTPYEDIPQTSKTFSEKINKLQPALPSREHPYHGLLYLYNEIVEDMNKFSELSKTVPILKTIKQPELFFVKYGDNKEQSATPQRPIETGNEQRGQVKPKEQDQKQPEPTRTVAGKPKIIHDTVYIEKTNTVYVDGAADNVRSMEGYATNNMVLLLDVSGSMNTPEKLPLLKSSVLDLLSMMRKEDEVSIVVYSGKAKVLLEPTSFKEEQTIRGVIEKLKSEGKTDGNAGLKLAYKVADENYLRAGNNRIILATDGEFPISDETFALVEKFSKNDIYISVFNFGKSTASSKNLQKLSETGKGNYEYITKENIELKLIREAKSKRSK